VCGLQPLAGDRLSLYIELNVAFKLTVEDASVVPQAEAKVRTRSEASYLLWYYNAWQRCQAAP
jgi:hypothetical protein